MRDGDHVAKAEGFVAIRDIHPKAETHLIVLPERHVDSFREVAEFRPEEAKRMLEFVADTAREVCITLSRIIASRLSRYPAASNPCRTPSSVPLGQPVIITPVLCRSP